MQQLWCWYGPKASVSIDDLSHAGVPLLPVEFWSVGKIEKRQAEIGTCSDGSASGLKWRVVESLPVSEDIKLQTGDWKQHLETYLKSLFKLQAAGIEVVSYNFMPVLGWTRTNLRYQLPTRAI